MKILSKKKITADNLKDFNGENLLTAKRNLRKPLLQAFDIYKSNVSYGVIIETEEEKAQTMAWYKNLLDLEDSALSSVPEKIKKYL